jgi:hypothetical protein
MPTVIVGYGEYSDYLLGELPAHTLEELGARYPLKLNGQSRPEYDELVITVAVHAEINRRKAGGKPERHTPSRRELAQMIVNKGFQQASKHRHPDAAAGYHDAQVRLNEVRDHLLDTCRNIPSDRPKNAVIIPKPSEDDVPYLTDDDVPF